MKYEPHNYQRYAIDYIKEHPISAILLDMGLGKTSITLTAVADLLFDSFEVSKVLVIAPLRVAKTTWKDEIQKWEHLKILKYSIITGTVTERLSALNKQADIYIINRENVQWLVENYKWDFDMVVIDELSSFKSWQSKRFKAFMKVRPKVKRIVGLTGTPSSNGLMDLFAEFKILDMGERLGWFISQYRNTYFLPDKRNGQVIYSYKPLPFAEKEIYNKLSDITISMKANDLLKMPELVINNIEVEMNSKEIKLYNKLKKDMVIDIDGKEIDTVNAAALSNKLLQMANGAIYDYSKAVVEIHNKKLDVLEDLIESSNGKPILVAYWYKHDKERIMKRFNAQEINTSNDIDKWNKGEMPVALIHPASAGHGLNLQQGGSTIVWFGLTWSLELYQQLNARLYRQGQKETVVIHHIITKNTIDENVIKALEKKDLSQNSLIEAVKWRLNK